MTQKSLAGLAIAAVLAVILATWLTSQRQTPTETESGGALVEGLKDQVNSVTRMVINDGDDQVTLERSDVGWGIAERGGYPADISQLRRKLLALSDAELVEPKTSNPDNYATLGVSDVDADDDQNTLVTLEGLDRSVSVIIGKSAQTRGATYVRRSGEDQSWLAQGDLALEANASRWLAKDLIDVQQSRIKRVVIQHPDQGPLEIVKAVSTDPNFAVVAIPEGRELAS
ncbi:MAG: DUF4340 domain-containing protein, partial [Xanthomonadales bacterium]|nr:DUF4340 domain-containing protein [Xanthomonadales bacterium]